MADLSWTTSWNESFRSSASTQIKSFDQDYKEIRGIVDKLDKEIAYIDRLMARSSYSRASSRSKIGFDRLPQLYNTFSKRKKDNDKLIESDKKSIKKQLDEKLRKTEEVERDANLANEVVNKFIKKTSGPVSEKVLSEELKALIDHLDNKGMVPLKNPLQNQAKLIIFARIANEFNGQPDNPHSVEIINRMNTEGKKFVERNNPNVPTDDFDVSEYVRITFPKLELKDPSLDIKDLEVTDDEVEKILNDERRQIEILGRKVSESDPLLQSKIDIIERKIFERLGATADGVEPPAITDTQQEKQQFLNQLVPDGYVIDENDQITVNPNATEETQKEAAKKMALEPGGSKPYRALAEIGRGVGVQSSRDTRTEQRLSSRRKQLEERRDKAIDSFAKSRKLNRQELGLLDHSILRVTGFREAVGLYDGLPAAAPVQAAPEAVEAVPEAAPVAPEEVDQNIDTTGVPVVPAVVNRLTKAINRAKSATNEDQAAMDAELTNVVDNFFSLPENVKDKFPQTFVLAAYEYIQPQEGKSGSLTERRMNLVNALPSLNDTAIVTQTIGEYVHTVKDTDGDTIQKAANLVQFLDNNDSLGDQSAGDERRGFSVRYSPIGTVASDFLNEMNLGEDVDASNLNDIFNRSQALSQQERPEFFDTNRYGRYASIDDFVRRMDAGRGERGAPPSAPEVDDSKLPDNPFPEVSRKAREFDRIAKEYDDKIAGEAEASRLFADLETQDVDLERDESEINRQAIATATRGSESSLRSPREVQLAAAAEKVAQEEDSGAILAAQDAERKASSERPTVTGIDDTPADRVLRESLADTPAPTVGETPSRDQEILSDEDKRKMDIAEFDSRPDQAPHGTVFPASAASTVTPVETIAPEGEQVSEEEMPPAQRQKLDEVIAGAEQPSTPADQPALVDGQLVDVESVKPGPGPSPGTFIEDAPVAPTLTPDQQLQQAMRDLPTGTTPRIGSMTIEEELEQQDKDIKETKEFLERQRNTTLSKAIQSAMEQAKTDPDGAMKNLEYLGRTFDLSPERIEKIKNSVFPKKASPEIQTIPEVKPLPVAGSMRTTVPKAELTKMKLLPGDQEYLGEIRSLVNLANTDVRSAVAGLDELSGKYNLTPERKEKIRSAIDPRNEASKPKGTPKFAAPVKRDGGMITSAATQRGGKAHEGLDLRARIGDEIFAIADGTIIAVNNDETAGGHIANTIDEEGNFIGTGPGKYVYILHDDGRVTKSMHLSAAKFSPGDKVKAGDVIGLAGNTGGSKGPHLHLEVHIPDEGGKSVVGTEGKFVVGDLLAEYPSVFKNFTMKGSGDITIDNIPQLRSRLGMDPDQIMLSE